MSFYPAKIIRSVCPGTASLEWERQVAEKNRHSSASRRHIGFSPGNTLVVLVNVSRGLVIARINILSSFADEILGKDNEHNGT